MASKGKTISEVAETSKVSALQGDELIPFAKNGSNGVADADTIKKFATEGLAKQTDVPTKVSELENDSKYQTKSDVDNALSGYVEKEDGKGLSTNDYTDADKDKLDKLPDATALKSALDDKVDKEDGKGLSTNDFTDKDKSKLDDIEDGAQVNTVDSINGRTGIVEGLAEVSDIPTKVSELTNDSKYQTESEVNSKINDLDKKIANKVDKVDGKELSSNDYTDADKNKLTALPTNAELTTTLDTKANKDDVNTALDTKVDATLGKGLSTEDFTTALKEKLQGLTNYDDTELSEKIDALKTRLDVLIGSGDVTTVIDTFIEIENFLKGVTNTQTLTGLLQEMKEDIMALCASTYVSLTKEETISGKKTFKESIKVEHSSDDRYSELTGASIRFYEPSNNSWSNGINFFKRDNTVIGSIGAFSAYSSSTKENILQYYYIGGTYNNPLVTVSPDGDITANSFIKKNGTSSQFLKADGSVDGKTYFVNGGNKVVTSDFIDISDYNKGAENYANFQPGAYLIQHSGYTSLFVNLATNSGSCSALQFHTTYENTANLKFRKTIDGNRVSGAWTIILTNLNYSSYALPLTGGTVKGTTTFSHASFGQALVVNRADLSSGAYIKFKNNSKVLGFIGMYASSTTTDVYPIYYTAKEDGTYGNGYKIWHAGNDGSGSGLDADLWDGEQRSDFRMLKIYPLNLNSLDNTKFYPVTFSAISEIECYLRSPNVSGTNPYNNNYIHFLLSAKGWNDVKRSLTILSQANWDNNEITIGAIGCGIREGTNCVWLRGGMTYYMYCNAVPTLRTSDYTNNGEVFTIGENLNGGTNSNVTTVWMNDATNRNNYLVIKAKVNNNNIQSISSKSSIAIAPTQPYSLEICNIAKANISNLPCLENANIIFNIWRASTISTNYSTQLGFTSSGMFYRSFTNKTQNTTDTWRKFAFEDSTVAQANCLTTTRLTNENLNNIVDTFRSYHAISTNTCTNKPTGVGAFNLIVSKRSSNENINQILISNNDNGIYHRLQKDGNWTAWKRLLTEDDLVGANPTTYEFTAFDGSSKFLEFLQDKTLVISNSGHISDIFNRKKGDIIRMKVSGESKVWVELTLKSDIIQGQGLDGSTTIFYNFLADGYIMYNGGAFGVMVTIVKTSDSECQIIITGGDI